VGKIIGGVVLVLILAVVGAGGYLLQNLDGIVKEVIEKVGSDVTGTDVKVAQVTIDLQGGAATLTGLTIANPAGFSENYLFAMEAVKVVIDVASMTGPVYVINEISVSGVQVLAEQKGSKTNIQALLNGMPQSEAADRSATDDSGDVKLAIQQINFAAGDLELRSDALGNHKVSLPGFKLNSIGSASDGKTPTEVGMAVATQLTSQIASAAGDAFSDIARQLAKEKLRKKLGDTATEGINKLKSLFGKDDG
jgi:hypothetical protein